MAPKSLLCSCFALCRQCCKKKRQRSRSLIPSKKKGSGGAGAGGGTTEDDEDDYSEDEEEEEAEEDVDKNPVGDSRYSAFDSPLFRRNSVNVDPDSSLERVDGERRGSLPLVSPYNDSMESVSTSTTSKLANFFTKKGFKSNMKRTKSATKLDRKRSSPNLSENDTSLINARIRSSRSHESLLASPPSMQSFDLRDPDAEVKPLHSSVLGQGHCFRVNTPQGSKVISCTDSGERDKWLNSLRRANRPHEEHSRRSDSSLKLWIVEAKNVAAKKRYFCEILLDKEQYALTSHKSMTDMLFWGEHFEFKNLPTVEIITINLYREADKKKKKDRDLLIGYINLNLNEMDNRQLIEKWITCNSGTVGKAGKETKSDLPIIRLKARRQTVDILPLAAYQSFTEYLTTDYKELCQLFEPLLAVREKEEFATSLVYILQKQSKACEFLSDIVMEEISRLDDEHLTFRGNSIATKSMEAYMKLVGEKYLKDTLGDFIRQLINSPDDCEVDPTKVATPQLLLCQQKNLDMYCTMAWCKVINSFCYFPNEMREVFASLRNRCSDRGKVDYSDNLISGCIFLRFLCPAILSPSLFNLTQEYPNERASRNLTLIAKTIQTLANFTQFGGKEEFMLFMNAFVEKEEANMKAFLHKISSKEPGNQFLQFDGYIDLGKELSVLHCLLLECMEKYSETSGKQFEPLSKILNTLSNAFDDPTLGQKKPNRKSQIYDNLVHIPSPGKDSPQNKVAPHTKPKPKNMTVSSPTEALKDMLRICGESVEDLPALANRGNKSDAGEVTTHTNITSSTHTMVSSVKGTHQVFNKQSINETWTQMVNAADRVKGDFVDLVPIPFMDEDMQCSSLDMESNTVASQVSSQVSTLDSSGYHSLGRSQSQSDSPVDSGGQGQVIELTREVTRSPIIYYPAATQVQAPQPLAFANPLFRHQQQPPRPAPFKRNGNGVETHRGMTLSQAHTVLRKSSDSSLDSSDDSSSKPQLAFVKTSAVESSDYHATIAPLKNLSQLSSSSSDDSLDGPTSLNVAMNSSHSSAFVHSTSANFISSKTSSKTSSSVMLSLGNSAMNGCSTFPRRHNRQQEQTNTATDVSPPLPPRDALVTADSGSPGLKGSIYHRQLSNPAHSPASVQNPRPTRTFQNRAGLTTTPTGHVQQRNFPGKNSVFQSNVDSNTQRQAQKVSNPGPKGFSSSNNSPASQHKLDSLTASPGLYRSNPLANSSNINSPSLNSRPQNITHRPPVSSGGGWQVAQHVERSSSSHESSSSSDSSPQSLVRSTQHNMHESSSAHSISSAPSSSQPWGYTPSHSDSNSSISSLTKINPRAPVRSDSSGSLGGLNISRISQTPSDSNSSMSSGNNNTSGLTGSNPSSTNQLDNHYFNHVNPFSARLSSVSDSQIHTSSLQSNPLPQPPAFLTSKYSVVHPQPTSPRTERSASYHSTTDSASSGSSSRSACIASRSMDLGFIGKNRGEPLKRASTDSTLSQPAGSLSPTGPGPSRPLSRDESMQSTSSSNNAANRRLSPQSTVHMGISSVQRKLQEQERTKLEYEQEVHVLRQQLLEAQEKLQQAEMKLLDHEVDTHKLLDEWQYRLVESEEKMRRQQAEKDEQMKAIMTKLHTIEEELKREQAEMASAVEHKQQVIEVQEQRIRKLDEANNKLHQALADLKARAARAADNQDENSNSALDNSCNGVDIITTEIAGFKTSSC
ncbi:ras GTPase-activating protein nGAP-like isoform X4 [Physella acuta]|uniref:ras GTPase-activating protein nGAP-like isoform X4 n=1 Tax=Physella acuta TaxID=109671 RepID=UPI0027DB1A8F|nr:ras GTPase-activating protein nGAP-like isoform X4 [Physella acuta]